MRALTIWQPYATRIIAGRKSVENRDWFTAYRGPLLIHAGVKIDAEAMLHEACGLPSGVIVGIVELVDVHRDEQPVSCAEATGARTGRAHWVLTNPRELPQIAVRGMPGLWHPKPELLAALGIDDGGNVAGSTT
jgi:hypothetical protein